MSENTKTNSSEELLLQVRDLHTSFFTDSGEVQAVNGVSFNLSPERSWVSSASPAPASP